MRALLKRQFASNSSHFCTANLITDTYFLVCSNIFPHLFRTQIILYLVHCELGYSSHIEMKAYVSGTGMVLGTVDRRKLEAHCIIR